MGKVRIYDRKGPFLREGYDRRLIGAIRGCERPGAGEHGGYLLYADSLTATNKPGDGSLRETESTVTTENKTVKTTVKKLSFSEYTIPLRRGIKT